MTNQAPAFEDEYIENPAQVKLVAEQLSGKLLWTDDAVDAAKQYLVEADLSMDECFEVPSDHTKDGRPLVVYAGFDEQKDTIKQPRARIKAAGLEVQRGAFYGTSDEVIDRWYLYHPTSEVIDRIGAGYKTLEEAADAAEDFKKLADVAKEETS